MQNATLTVISCTDSKLRQYTSLSHGRRNEFGFGELVKLASTLSEKKESRIMGYLCYNACYVSILMLNGKYKKYETCSKCTSFIICLH